MENKILELCTAGWGTYAKVGIRAFVFLFKLSGKKPGVKIELLLILSTRFFSTRYNFVAAKPNNLVAFGDLYYFFEIASFYK